MAQGRAARKLDEEPAPVHFGTLAAPPGPDGGYLPSRDDQSWRELEALRIATAFDEDPSDITADQEFDQQEDVPEPDSTSRGQGGILFLMAAMAALVIVALAFPDMADLRRAPRAVSAAAAPARAANIPASAPALKRLTPPVPANDPVLNPGLNTEPAASERDDRGAVRSGTMVISPDGKVKYENGGPFKRASVRHDADDRGTDGFYAKVPGPDGTLRYQYFPSAR
jgi:hypothetical protein